MIPTNRIDPWLDIAVESVLADRLTALDLVVVLDGVDLPEPHRWSSDPRVRILRNPVSLGPSAAMTAAIASTDATYIARLDSDDRDLPDRLARQVDYLESHPEAVAVSSRTIRIDEHGARNGTVRLPAGPDIRRHLLLSNVVPHSSLTMRRSALEEAGGYDASLRQMEDYDLILRLAALGPIAQLDEPLVEYRVHAGQTSRGAAPRGLHIRIIRRRRSALASALGVSRLRAALKHAAWLAVQYLRWWGALRPGHER